ncbi:TIGR03085 family metal-binding protein [Kytococcus sedentarius]|uniref:TIGR03085 family metal-binding protein n=1 Tax=Kytococcus sedentarius TaxID=1276 RepID=UPI0035BC5D1E
MSPASASRPQQPTDHREPTPTRTETRPGSDSGGPARLLQAEREALVASFRAAGPDAPTLCEGWTTRDLAAHMVARESRPDVLPGIGLPGTPAEGHTEKVQGQYAGKDWGTLLARFSRGPAPWMPFALPVVGPAVNLGEYVVHHEDVRRAVPGWTVRRDDELQHAVWRMLTRAGGLTHRKSPVGVVLVAPGIGRTAAKRPPEGRGTVVLTGEPVELLLFSFGRESVAQVELSGDPADVDALRSHRRAM